MGSAEDVKDTDHNRSGNTVEQLAVTAGARQQEPLKSWCPVCHETGPYKLVKREPATRDPRRSPELRAMELAIVRCAACGGVFVRRDFPAELLERHYSQTAGGGFAVNRENFGWWLQATEGSLRHVLKVMARYARGPLLDVGCGAGMFPYLARLEGWDPTGLDVNAEFTTFLNEQIGIEAVQGTLWTAELRPGRYQAVTLIDVLEHLYDPVSTLRRCRELLRPGGIVVVKSPYWRAQYMKESLKKTLRTGTGDIANLGHINQFDPRSLATAFRNAGLLPLSIQPAKSFVPGIHGAPFSLNQTLSYVATSSMNALFTAIHKTFGWRMGFNLVAVATRA